MTTWTKPSDIKSKIESQWKKGNILRYCLLQDDLFPLRIKLNGPSPKELALNFSDAINWIAHLKESEKSKIGYGYEIIEKETNYRMNGKNSVPTHATISSSEDAIKLIHKQKEVKLFERNAQDLLQKWPILQQWIIKYPLKLIKNIGADCDKIISVLKWFENHPDHYLYLRQLDIPGIDTKFIEKNKPIISELLDIILPAQQINDNSKRFEERFTLKLKPKMIRFRFLDDDDRCESFSDLTVPIEEFSKWKPAFKNIFFTENEINFLSFPQVKNSCIIFGKGYGVELLKMAEWMRQKNIYYWGDIDTHGFNILSMARGFLPDLKSFLMTEDVLLAHRKLWVTEDKPHLADIKHLTDEEYALAYKLQTDYFGKRVRLEQERITFGLVEKFIDDLTKSN